MLQGRLNVEDFRYLQEANANHLFLPSVIERGNYIKN